MTNYQRKPNTVYVASLSYGKDSIAMLEAIKQLGMPLDRIIHAEVWATDDISADLPPMVEFKKYADNIIKDRYGIEVEHTCAMRKVKPVAGGARETETDGECHPCKLTYERQFYTERFNKERQRNVIYGFPCQQGSWCKKLKSGSGGVGESYIRKTILPHSETQETIDAGGGSSRIPASQGELVQRSQKTADSCSQQLQGSRQSRTGAMEVSKCQPYDKWSVMVGFPARHRNWCNSQLKASVLDKSKKAFSDKPVNDGQKINIVQYLGIAADEPERIKRHTKDGIILPLVEIGWDEAYCRKWCEENDLLSPIYTSATRGGCWFCHNQGVNQLRLLRRNYPDLWALLMKWDLDSPVTFKSDGHTVHDFDARFQAEDDGIVPTDRKFRWKMVEDYNKQKDESTRSD